MEPLKLEVLQQIDEIKQKLSQLENEIKDYNRDQLIEVDLELFQVLFNLEECL